MPPMYSAVKINGQPLYKAARKGQTVARKARPIVIHSLSLTERVSDVEYRLQIHCGKGTYVRVLIEDIGKALGVPATMSCEIMGSLENARAAILSEVERVLCTES